MARKKSQAAEEKDSRKDLLRRIRRRHKVMTEADDENRRDAMEDLRFVTVPGAQWDENMKKERGDRPCYEFDKLGVTAKRIINAWRMNRASGKVRGTEDNDKDTAEIFEGLIRNIWNNSDGDTVTDHAALYQVRAGMGAWRISTKYASDTAFDQDICIEPIENPFCLYSDPSCKDQLKRDAEDWILTERISKSSFRERWPKAEVVDYDASEFDDEEDWEDEDTVRVCEYWWKEPVEREVLLLADGRTIRAEEADGIPAESIVRRRTVKAHRIMTCIASGAAILEGPTEWAGSMFPFVMVYGEYAVVDGRKLWYGIVRKGKDSQRSYNIARTAVDESVALAPQAKYWATAEQALGHTDKWAEAHKKNFPFLLYNGDAKALGPPQRMGGADVPAAVIAQLNLASEDIKAVTGIFDASLGAKSNEQSGKAINARQAQGEIATFEFQDNLAKGVRRTWEILVDLIPKVYDTERALRVLGADGSEKYVRVNQVVIDPATQNPKTIHDLAAGKFDVTVTIGPNFSTRRQEAAELYTSLAQANPAVFGVAGDLIMKSFDLPYSEEIADRLRAMLPPPIQQMIQQGKEIPPEVQMLMNQAQQAMQQVQMQMQAVQQAAQQLQGEQADVEKGKGEIEKLIANLKTEEARFDARVAKEMARIAERQAQVSVAENNQLVSAEQQRIAAEQAVIGESSVAIRAEIAQVIESMQAFAAQFAQEASAAMAQIQSQAARPKVVRIESRREHGRLVAVPVYES